MSLLDAILGDNGLVVKFKADLTGLQAGILQAKADLTSWRDATNKNTVETGKWAAAISAVVVPVMAAGAALHATQEKFGEMASEITDLSMTTGLTTDKIQQLQYAALLSNTAFSNVTMGVNQLTLAISKSGDASSDAGKAFAELGVSTNGRSVDQVFEDTTAALMGMEDTTRRNEIAMTLYGRSWKEMLPFMDDYIKNKEKIQKTPTFSKQDLQDLKDAKKAWDDLGNSVTIYTGKALVEVQKGTSFLVTMDAAYRKLAVGNVGGFLDDAAKERERQIQAEHDKLTALLETNAGGPAITPEVPEVTPEVEKETDAQKELKAAIEDVASAKEKLNDINKDYAREMSILNPRDVSAARDLSIRHAWAVEDQQSAITKAQGKVAEKYGDVIVNVDSKTIAKVPGVAAGTSERSLTQAGY